MIVRRWPALDYFDNLNKWMNKQLRGKFRNTSTKNVCLSHTGMLSAVTYDPNDLYTKRSLKTATNSGSP